MFSLQYLSCQFITKKMQGFLFLLETLLQAMFYFWTEFLFV